MTIAKIISGGQTGVDQAALLAAMEVGLDYGGTAPEGRMTEAGPLGAKFIMDAAEGTYRERTVKNIMDSTYTLILNPEKYLTGGTRMTWRAAQDAKRPVSSITIPEEMYRVIPFLRGLQDDPAMHVLNVAGPRESKFPGFGKCVRELLADALKAIRLPPGLPK